MENDSKNYLQELGSIPDGFIGRILSVSVAGRGEMLLESTEDWVPGVE